MNFGMPNGSMAPDPSPPSVKFRVCIPMCGVLDSWPCSFSSAGDAVVFKRHRTVSISVVTPTPASPAALVGSGFIIPGIVGLSVAGPVQPSMLSPWIRGGEADAARAELQDTAPGTLLLPRFMALAPLVWVWPDTDRACFACLLLLDGPDCGCPGDIPIPLQTYYLSFVLCNLFKCRLHADT